MSLYKEITHDIGRVFVVGDIHGMYDLFFEKLNEVDFDFENDIVIAVGDLVDRGPKSLDCFNLIYQSWFHSVRGNHEEMFAIYNNDNKILDTDYSMHVLNGGEWLYELPEDVIFALADKANSLPIIMTLNRNGKRYGFVHADLPKSLDDWNNVEKSLNDKDNYQTYIWGRRIIQSICYGRIDSQIVRNVDHIYFGHTIIPNVKTSLGKTFLDTGAFDTKKLTLLEIGI